MENATTFGTTENSFMGAVSQVKSSVEPAPAKIKGTRDEVY